MSAAHRRRRFIFAILLACLAFACSVAAQSVPAVAAQQRLTLEQYLSALDGLIADYEVVQPDEACCSQRPPDVAREWTVNAGGNEFHVGTEFLDPPPPKPKNALTSPNPLDEKTEPTSSRRELILTRLRALRDAASSFQNAQTQDSELLKSKAQVGARQILARGEFRKVRSPGAQDSLRDRLNAWFERLMRRLFSHAPNANFTSKTLIWILIVVAAILAGFWLRGVMQRSEQQFHLNVGGAALPLSSKPWREWLAEAHAAAAEQRWRDAVHLGYWAGISALEANGAWKPDKARTPREYPRLMHPDSERHSTLVSLTGRFERVWYAQWPATQEDYEQMLRDLEQIGCRA